MSKYVRKLGVEMPSFAVYTPLPGTELWQEREADLITRNYNYFDFAHPVLPTKLPFRQFFKEYFRLTSKALPIRKKLKFLRSMSPGARKKYLKLFMEAKRKFNEHRRKFMFADNWQ